MIIVFLFILLFLCSKSIYDYMPKHIIEDGTPISSWVDSIFPFFSLLNYLFIYLFWGLILEEINLAHQQLAGKHLTEIRIKFLSRVRTWKLYGSSLFKVEVYISISKHITISSI